MEKKITIVGAGNIGKFAAYTIAKEFKSIELNVLDIDKTKINDLKRKIKDENIKFLVGDIFKDSKIKNIVCESDIILSFLPGYLGAKIYDIAIECSIHLVDTSYMNTDPFIFDAKARDSGITIVPDAGIAPGLSNIISGHIYSEMKPEKLGIYVGGLPLKPRPPLYHEVNWSISDLLEEYIRPVKIKVEGEVKIVEPLSGKEEIDLGKFGTYEAFYTDGLRTMIKTLRVPNMFEKTLRYKGHLKLITFLKELGFLSKESIKIGDSEIRPIDLTLKLLTESVYNPNLRDKLVMKVYGEKENKSMEYIIYDEFDENTQFSAMARTTGLANVVITKLILEKRLEKGVIPPEIIGQTKRNFKDIIKYYKKHKIEIKKKTNL